MRARMEILGTLIGLVAVPSIVLIYQFAPMPPQPAHAAVARVVAITPWGKLYNERDSIVVRNARGTGQFSMRAAEIRCHVGDRVPVRQQGITLTRVARTCR
jgi:hypothetical protein